MYQKEIISSDTSWASIDFREIYKYRQLLFSLAWRDIRVKYAQTFIGLLWALVQPVITIILLSFVFQKVANISTSNVPPLIFTLTGFLCWSYFSVLINSAGDSIIESQSLIQKVYFPRILLPISKAISGLVEFFVMIVLLILLMFYFSFTPSKNIILFPLLVFLTMLFALGGGIWISALTIRFRDFRFITPFIIQIGLFLSPIAYPISSVPEKYAFLYSLNPMVGIIEASRWSIFGTQLEMSILYYSILSTLLLLVSGIFYFHKMERSMADII